MNARQQANFGVQRTDRGVITTIRAHPVFGDAAADFLLEDFLDRFLDIFQVDLRRVGLLHEVKSLVFLDQRFSQRVGGFLATTAVGRLADDLAKLAGDAL